jgi:hypothetical protein
VGDVTDPGRYDAPQRAVRLTFEFEGEEVRLVSLHRVAMLVPPPDEPGREEAQAGFWYEVLDAQDRPMYRRGARNPLRSDIEVFGEGPDGSFTHVEMPQPRGVFTLLVPDLEDARTLALIGAPPGPTQEASVAREIARFDLTADPPIQRGP